MGRPKKAKFPKTLYVRIAGDEPDQYIDAQEEAEAHGDLADPVREVAIYELVRVAKLKTNSELT